MSLWRKPVVVTHPLILLFKVCFLVMKKPGKEWLVIIILDITKSAETVEDKNRKEREKETNKQKQRTELLQMFPYLS